jgi:hypothetical protein
MKRVSSLEESKLRRVEFGWETGLRDVVVEAATVVREERGGSVGISWVYISWKGCSRQPYRAHTL